MALAPATYGRDDPANNTNTTLKNNTDELWTIANNVPNTGTY